MSTLSKVIGISLIVMAVVATGYTGYFAKEYTDSLNALAEFSAYLEFDPTDIKTQENISYLEVIVTMDNPAGVKLNVYELDIALFLMNSTTGSFDRIGDPVLFFSEYRPIVVDPESQGQVRFYLVIDDVEDYRWNMEHSGENFRVDPYMELRYTIEDYDFRSLYAWGMWHWTCKECGRGPFD